MTVTTLASIAANISRTPGNTNAKAASVFNSLFADSNAASKQDSTNLTATLGLKYQVAQLRVASQNIAQTTSLLAAAENAAGDIFTDLDKLATLVKRATSETISPDERKSIASEIETVRARIDRTAKSTKFNNEALLDGSSPQLKLASENKNIKDLSIGSLTDQALFKGRTPDVATVAAAKTTEGFIKEAKAYASKQLENIRALQQGLDFAASTLQSAIQNQEASRSTLDDGDLVAQLLGGSSANNDVGSLLAQTNRLPGNLLGLLGE